MTDRVRHKGTPAEPFATPNAYGLITRTTPKKKGIPAMAYVSWNDGEYESWERLADLAVVAPRKGGRD